MRTYLYYLTDPRSGEVRYVGWTVDTVRRLKGHLKPKAQDKSHRANWVRSLVCDGFAPLLVVKAILLNAAEAKTTEVRAIAVLRARGYRLVNSTVGGDGFSSESWTPEFRERARISHLGQIPVNKGSKQSEEGRRKSGTGRRNPWNRGLRDPWAPARLAAYWTPARIAGYRSRGPWTAEQKAVYWTPARRVAYEAQWGKPCLR